MKKIVFFTTGRDQGNARSPRELNRILKARRVPGALATAEQVHRSKVVVVPRLGKPKKYPGADGLLTDVINQPLGIFTADCAPIFLQAPKQNVVGVLHAGWRGVQSKILARALRLMRRTWHSRAADVRLRIGPCIGPCCFEVRWDVARYFPHARRRSKDRWVVDLPSAIAHQARRLGVPAAQITRSLSCTAHQPRYHSFRRDQTEARQISMTLQKERS